MPSAPLPRQQWPRGPWNKLHDAALGCSAERLIALLSDGSIDINQGDPKGDTPLMVASQKGHSRAVRIMLDKGANVSVEGEKGFSALHYSASGGHLAVSKMLVNAGADLEAATPDGITPLYLASEKGHLGVMSALIKAGANPDSRGWCGATPLYMTTQNGDINALKMLLRAKANPLLTRTDHTARRTYVPLDVAAQKGHSEGVRELVQQVGIEGCGGASGGLQALRLAAMSQHVDIMAVLTDAGVVDPGEALIDAATGSRESSMKFLLQQKATASGKVAYANHRDIFGATPLLRALGYAGVTSPSPRTVRLLVDVGADTTSAVRLTNTEGKVSFHGTPLTLVSCAFREKRIAGKDATEEQLRGLEGIRRLLLRVEAVRAVSFLWPDDISSVIATPSPGGTNKTVAASTPLRMMLPILRRRARRSRVLLAALFRSTGKP